MAPERVKEMVARADKLGVPRNSGMFKNALDTVQNLSPETISAKMDFLRRALGCSKSEVGIAVCRSPRILSLSEDNLGRTVEFLKVEVGLEAWYIVHMPAMLQCSILKWLMPRHYVLKVLKAKGLVKRDIDFYSVVCLGQKRLVEKFLDCYKESVPWLLGAYDAACAGQVPLEIKA
uniref:Uncharacterized protein n=1 Tax=Arundo donax TaxID=35708 RepID=A0A0A9G0Q5_ARUDO